MMRAALRTRARSAWVGALLLLPGVVAAQIPSGLNGSNGVPDRQRLRDTARPASQAKLDEAVKKFEDDDLLTKLEGITQLGQVDDRAKATGYLLQAANDPEGSVRLKAIDVLGNMKAEGATPSLVQLLFMRDTDNTTKQHVLVALGKIGDPRTTKPILDFIARPGDDGGMDGNAIYALGEIGDKSAIPALERIAREGDTGLRPLAQSAIQRIRQKPEPDIQPPALAADRRRAGGEAEERPPVP